MSNAFNCDRARYHNGQVYSPVKGDKADKTTETDYDYDLSSLFIGRGAIWEH